MRRPEVRTIQTPEAVVHGVKRRPLLLDIYHLFLAASWWQALAAIVGAFLSLNLLFSVLYLLIGGVTGSHSWLDAFAFSVQTMATIGYGGMAPETAPAHVLVIAEAVFGLLFTALTTGLVFAKFTLAPVSLVFAERVTIHKMNNRRTLAVRVGNERGSLVVDANIRVVFMRTETTDEGVTWYRMIDVPLQRSWMPAVTRGWSVLHTIDESSPLHGATAESLAEMEAELIVTISGMDQTTLQPAHAMKRYSDSDFRFGQRHADMTSTDAEGRFHLDVTQFNALVAADL